MSKQIAIAVMELARAQFEALRLRFEAEPPKNADEENRGRVILAALLFCEQNSFLAATAMESEFWLHEPLLSRPMMETSIRLLYAITVSDGWRRYFRYYANEKLSWAKEAQKCFPAVDSYTQWVTDAQKEVDALPVEPMRWRLHTAMDELLEAEAEIAKQEGDFLGMKKQTGKEVELMLFQIGHMVIHAHPDYLSENMSATMEGQTFNTLKGVLFGHAAYLMTRAVYRFRNWPNREKDAVAVLERMKAISHKA